MDCLFCKIINREIPAEIVYEDEQVLAFLDIYPRSPGHTVVIPRVHATTIVDLPYVEINPLFSVVKRVTARIDAALTPQGFTIGLNHGSVSGQTVPHIHVHIIPRYDGDGGGSIHSVVDYHTDESLASVGSKIRHIK